MDNSKSDSGNTKDTQQFSVSELEEALRKAKSKEKEEAGAGNDSDKSKGRGNGILNINSNNRNGLMWILISLLFLAVILSAYTNYKQNSSIRYLKGQVDELSTQNRRAPKIMTLDLLGVAKSWKGQDSKITVNAIDTTIKYFNDQGYLILDEASIIGDSSKYAGKVPSPDEMRRLKSK